MVYSYIMSGTHEQGKISRRDALRVIAGVIGGAGTTTLGVVVGQEGANKQEKLNIMSWGAYVFPEEGVTVTAGITTSNETDPSVKDKLAGDQTLQRVADLNALAYATVVSAVLEDRTFTQEQKEQLEKAYGTFVTNLAAITATRIPDRPQAPHIPDNSMNA